MCRGDAAGVSLDAQRVSVSSALVRPGPAGPVHGHPVVTSIVRSWMAVCAHCYESSFAPGPHPSRAVERTSCAAGAQEPRAKSPEHSKS